MSRKYLAVFVASTLSLSSLSVVFDRYRDRDATRLDA